MMKRKAAGRPQAASVPPFRVNGSGGFFYMLKQLLPFFGIPPPRLYGWYKRQTLSSA